MKSKFSIFKLTLCLFVGIAILVVPISSAFSQDIKFKTMTRNLYLGADIFKVVEAAQIDPDSVPWVVAEIFQTMLYTDFWERAEALADEIAAAKPQVIGLQEVTTYYIQTPGDFIFGNPTEATDLVIDFYTVLNDALEARGMFYTAFTVTNADVELPMFDPDAGAPYYLSDVRMVDHDVVLVRTGTTAWQVLANNYAFNVGLDLGGVYIEFTRGFVIVDTLIKGVQYRFVNTHLEVRSDPESVFRVVQSAQMQELLGTLAYLSFIDPQPIIMVGDFNSSPTDVPGNGLHPVYGWLPYVPPYMQAVTAGYLDAWLLQSKYDEGYTSGFDEDVSDPTAELTSRIDLVFIDPLDQTIDKVSCDIVGDEVSDMTPSGLWPSDHAGVVAKVKFITPE